MPTVEGSREYFGLPPKLISNGLPFVAGILTIAAYLGWLGWHDVDYYYDSSGRQGPYYPWQVGGLGVTLGVLALTGGFFRKHGSTATAITVVLVVVWSLDHSYQPEPADANLWPVGAMFLAVGSALGLSLAAYIGLVLRRLADRRDRRR